MKKYQCIVCGFIYDAGIGWPHDGIAAGTKWAEAPPIGNARIAVLPRLTLKWSRFDFSISTRMHD